MDLRHLRYLIAAVEEGSFQGAAQRMNVAQPALSRRIRDLETDLGCELLTRGTRGVTPTRAGAAFYRKAVTLLAELDQASQVARRMGMEQAHVAKLGLVQTSRKYAFVHAAIASCQREAPHVTIALTRDASPQLAAALRQGQLDVSLLYEWRMGSRGLNERLIHKESYVLAVHPDHRLAQDAPADLGELAGEPLVWLSRRDNPDSHDALLQQCRLHGLDPAIGHMAHSHDEQMDLMAVSGGVCLTPASTMLSTPAGALRFRPLPRFEMEINLSLAWNADLGASPATALLAHLHAAIDRHQAEVAEGRAPSSRLWGEPVVRAP